MSRDISIEDLSFRLDLLKEIKQSFRPGTADRLRIEIDEAESILGRSGLGLMWQDSEECYMVYSLESFKE